MAKEKNPAPAAVETPGETDAAAKRADFPKDGLPFALRVAQAIEEKNAGRPYPPDELKRALKIKTASTFRAMLAASSKYDLTVGTAGSDRITLTATGRDIIAPSSPDTKRDALIRAFFHPESFAGFYRHYAGKTLPEEQYVANTLVRDFGIQKGQTKKFLEVFLDGAAYVGLQEKATSGQLSLKSAPTEATPSAAAIEGAVERVGGAKPAKGGGKQGDTCFVLMPFGDFFDKYYANVYEQAIAEADLIAVRADGIFSAGQVIDQIWQHISKAKVLLAELTDKNTNVFYELGLAHAAGKPVVLVAARIDDVPYDLRHLRVIVYDQRDPFWGEELKARITEFLNAAKSSPGDAVPDAFQRQA